MVSSSLDHVMVRLVGLQVYLPTKWAPPSATCNLGQHLESTLSGVKIRQVQTNICQDYPNQGDQG